MAKKRFNFTAVVKIFPMVHPWVYVDVPSKFTQNIQRRSFNGFIPVEVGVGKSVWRTSLLPKGDGTLFIALKAEIRKKEKIEIG